jgi:hypothetical protein
VEARNIANGGNAMRHLFAIFAIALYLSLGANAIAQKLDVLPLLSGDTSN